MRHHVAKRLLFALCLFFVPHAAAEGFWAGTLVKTPRGLQAIDQLKPGNIVCCCDESGNFATSRIAAVRIKKASACTTACVAGEELVFLSSQKFYQLCTGDSTGFFEPAQQDIQNCWLPGYRLRPSLLMLSKLEQPVAVDAVEPFNLTDGTLLEFYALSLSEHHNYFVTRQELLVHNAFLAIIPVFTWVFGGGITFAKVSAIAASVAVAFGMSKLDKELSKKGIDASMSYCGQQPVAVPQPEYVLRAEQQGQRGRSGAAQQESSDNNGGNREKLVYVGGDAVYHHVNSQGIKSPGFSSDGEGQWYLDLSTPAISETSDRRFAVIDKNTFGVFSHTGTVTTGNTTIEKYHGYKTDWDGLGQSIQQEFQRLGLTNHKGKILKK